MLTPRPAPGTGLLLVLLLFALGGTRPAFAAEPAPPAQPPPGVVVAAASFQQAVIQGDWAATTAAAPAAHFPAWPTAADSENAFVFRYFFSGALILPRLGPEIAYYNPWLDAAILTRWQPASADSPGRLLALHFFLPSAGSHPGWLATAESPLLSLPRIVRDFDQTWRERGLALLPRAVQAPTAPAFLARAQTLLASLVDGHRRLAASHPALHQALAQRRVEAWAARLPASADALRDRLLGLDPLVRDRLVLGAAIPLGPEGRHLLVLWPDNLPRIAVLLLYNPRTTDGLTDLVLADLNQLAASP